MTARRASETMFASLDATTGPTEGNDILNVASGQSVDGLGGDDRISSGTGNETLIGSGGNDTLTGSGGNDVLIGGTGDDQYIFDDYSGQDEIVNFDTNPNKKDVVILTDVSEEQLNGTGYGVFRIGSDWIMKWNTGAQITIKDTYLGSDYQITELRMKKAMSQTEDVTFTMREMLERFTVNLTAGDDTLGASDLSERIRAGAGNDRIEMGLGNDYAYGEDGNDTLDGGTGNDTLGGGLGDDLFILRIGDGDDTITSSDGTVGRVDTIKFVDIASTGVNGLTRIVNDLVLRYGASDQVTLQSNFGSPTGTVTRFEFSDGVTWNLEDLYAAHAIRLTDADENVAFPSNLGETVYAGAGNDIIDARSGNDKLYGEVGNDSLIGNVGTDTLHGGDGTDTVMGGADNDTLFGDGGNDSLSGDAGDDSLNGGAGDDSMNGLAGNDIFDAGAGKDAMNGGSGNDIFILRVGAGQDTITLYDNTTVGKLDVIRFEDVASTQLTSVTRAGYNLTISYGSGDSVTLANYYFDTYSKFSTLEFSDGTSFRPDQLFARYAIGLGSLGDTMAFTDDVETVHGAAGNDVLQGLGGSDVLYGEADNDNLTGGTGNDTLLGGAGNDTLNGSEGDDLLDGGLGNDAVTANTGDDTVLLRIGAGQDSVTFGDGTAGRIKALVFEDVAFDDLTAVQRNGWHLVLSYGTSDEVTLINYFSGTAAEVNKMQFSDGTRTVADILAAYPTALTGAADSAVFTRNWKESIDAGAGNDTVDAAGGDDAIRGEVGNDSLTGGAGSDTLAGGSGNDVLIGGTENDLLAGDEGSDVLTGDSGDDRLSGGLDGDTLTGGVGNDTLDGGAGNDSLTGDTGNDTYLLRVGSGADTISLVDTSSGSKIETVRFEDVKSTALTAVSRAGNNLILGYGDGDSVNFTGYFTGNRFTTLEFSDYISLNHEQLFARYAVRLTELANNVTFGDTVETIQGGAGSDIIGAMGGNDVVYGEADNDNLNGGAGDDTLDGGIGNDNLATGAGNDVVLLRAGAGTDILNLADATTGRIKTVVFESIDSANIGPLQRVGSNLVLNYTATDQVTINNFFGGPTNFADKLVFADRTWTAQDLLTNREIGLSGVADTMVFTLLDETVKAGAGNDNITGGAGRDRLYGELGNDTLNGGADDDGLFGGDGLDSLLGSTGNDTVDGELGVDTVLGEAGDDVLRGGGGNDSLDGGLGNDRLDGGTENDALTGGAGNDTYVFHRGSGVDTVNVYDTGAARVETVWFDDIVATQLTSVVRSGNNLVLSYGTADKVTVTSQFTSAAYAVNGFKFADGQVYTAAELQALPLGAAATAGHAEVALVGVASLDMFA